MNAPRRSPHRSPAGPGGPLRSRRLIRGTAVAGLLGLGAVALAGCGSSSANGGDNGKVQVMASFYPMEFLAEEIGGEYVDVQTLVKPGVEPHDLELTPQQTGELSEADLAVYLKGLQPAVDQAIEQSEVAHVAEATSYTSLKQHGTDVHGEKGHEEKGHDDEGHEHGGHEGGAHEGHDHSHDSEDPHIWLDPLRYAQVAEGVGKELAKADPEHKAQYEKNTQQLVERLKALDKDFKDGLAKKQSDTFITTHAAFGYLAERYGLHEEAVAGLNPQAKPSAARIKELHEVAGTDEVDTVFFEDTASDKTARTLADDLNLKTGVLSPLGTLKHPEKQDYFSVMQQNLKALQTALDAR